MILILGDGSPSWITIAVLGIVALLGLLFIGYLLWERR